MSVAARQHDRYELGAGVRLHLRHRVAHVRETVVPFPREAAARGEAAIALTRREPTELLRSELGALARRVHFAESFS